MKLTANAKINIGLNVVERRSDGYHNIETVFYPIGLCDKLVVRRLDGSKVQKLESSKVQTLEGLQVDFRASGLVVDCKAEDNLIVRAAKMLLQDKHEEGVRIDFEKIIPFGAGLGGGSSDAAHTALAINELYNLGLSKEELKRQVSTLGADCAFFIENTPCLASGIGEILTPISLSLEGYGLVLVKPDEFVSTKAAYAGVRPRRPERPLCDLITLPVSKWKGLIHNDFEDSVFPAFPAIARVKETLYEMGAEYAAMSGSGASVFGLFPVAEMPSQEALEKAFAGCFIHTEILH